MSPDSALVPPIAGEAVSSLAPLRLSPSRPKSHTAAPRWIPTRASLPCRKMAAAPSPLPHAFRLPVQHLPPFYRAARPHPRQHLSTATATPKRNVFALMGMATLIFHDGIMPRRPATRLVLRLWERASGLPSQPMAKTGVLASSAQAAQPPRRLAMEARRLAMEAQLPRPARRRPRLHRPSLALPGATFRYLTVCIG